MPVDSLAPTTSAPYASEVTLFGWWTRHRKLLAVSAALILATAICWLLAVHTVDTLVMESFKARSISYVQAFASSATPWVDPAQPAMLTSAARFMLVGSARFVQVVIGGAPVVDERSEAASTWTLDVLPSENLEGTFLRSIPESSEVLDIAVPLTESEGYVRMGIDTNSVSLRVNALALWSGALGLGVDALLLALLWWLFGIRGGRTPHASREGIPLAGGTVQSIGALAIDPIRKQVSYRETPVRLTPKQYALLEFLGRHPDRVFSDREIVKNVWQDSPYADSKDVKQYIYLIRRRLSAIHADGRRLIETVPGFGYRLVSEVVDETLTD